MHRLFVLLVFLPLFCASQIPKPKPNTYINDYTNNLAPEEIHALNEQILQLEKQTTVQVAILLIKDLPAGMSIEDYAREVGNTWKVGKSFNGIVYVAVINEHRQRLEIAKNLEGAIPDITAAEIINNLKPQLQQQDYYGALSLLITQIGVTVGAETSTTTTPGYYPAGNENSFVKTSSTALTEKTEFEKKKAKYEKYGNYAIAGIVLGMIGFIVWAWKYKKKYYEMYTINGVYTGIGSVYYPVDSSDSSGGSSGFGGFGGGGGGGFSGGGASGSW